MTKIEARNTLSIATAVAVESYIVIGIPVLIWFLTIGTLPPRPDVVDELLFKWLMPSFCLVAGVTVFALFSVAVSMAIQSRRREMPSIRGRWEWFIAPLVMGLCACIGCAVFSYVMLTRFPQLDRIDYDTLWWDTLAICVVVSPLSAVVCCCCILLALRLSSRAQNPLPSGD